jgi:serine/threonine-protein kinase RsbW
MSDQNPSSITFRDSIVLHGREDIDTVERRVMDAVNRNGYDTASGFAIRLAVEEALMNAFKHGNKSDPTKKVWVRCLVDPQVVEVEIEDEGEGFDPTAVPDPTEQDNIEIPSGRGLMLMRAYMTAVRFSPQGNRVTLRYEKRSV